MTYIRQKPNKEAQEIGQRIADRINEEIADEGTSIFEHFLNISGHRAMKKGEDAVPATKDAKSSEQAMEEAISEACNQITRAIIKGLGQ